MRYEIQHGKDIDGYRITDTETDSRVATCFAEENAKRVCGALNVQDKFEKRLKEVRTEYALNKHAQEWADFFEGKKS